MQLRALTGTIYRSLVSLLSTYKVTLLNQVFKPSSQYSRTTTRIQSYPIPSGHFITGHIQSYPIPSGHFITGCDVAVLCRARPATAERATLFVAKVEADEEDDGEEGDGSVGKGPVLGVV